MSPSLMAADVAAASPPAHPWPAWFPGVTRHHYGLGPQVKHPAVKPGGWVDVQWRQWDAWNAWEAAGRKPPRPAVWTHVPRGLWASDGEIDFGPWKLRSEWVAHHHAPPVPPPPPSPVVMPNAGMLEGVWTMEGYGNWTDPNGSGNNDQLRWLATLDGACVHIDFADPVPVSRIARMADHPFHASTWAPYWVYQRYPDWQQRILDRLGTGMFRGHVFEIETPMGDAPANALTFGPELRRRGYETGLCGPNWTLVNGHPATRLGRLLRRVTFKAAGDVVNGWVLNPSERVPPGFTLAQYSYCDGEVDPPVTPSIAVGDTAWHIDPLHPSPLTILVGLYWHDAAKRAVGLRIYQQQLPPLMRAGRVRGVGVFLGGTTNPDEQAWLSALAAWYRAGMRTPAP